MKKFILMALLAVGTMAHAEDYKYLTVGYNSEEQSIDLGTIQKITFENGQMVVVTSEGNVSFTQSELEKMFFSTTATAIEGIANDQTQTNAEGTYDLAGRKVPQKNGLRKGIYIVDGKKVVIK